jgi:hypothetical protein
MIRRLVGFFVILVVAIGATAACGGHRPAQMPDSRKIEQVPNVQLPVKSVIKSCWAPEVRGQYTETFDNGGSSTPTVFKIEDRATGEVICLGVVRAADKAVGPAIWAHRTATTEWVVTGTSYITVVDSTRTEGLVDARPVRLEYSRGYGWYTRCPC